MQRVCVFVDGENFRHSIVDLCKGEFDPTDYLPKNAQWEAFFDSLVNQIEFRIFYGDSLSDRLSVHRLRTYWYVVQHVDFKPYKIPKPRDESEEFIKVIRLDKGTRTELDSTGRTPTPEALDRIYKRLTARKQNFLHRFDGWQFVQNGISEKHKSIEFRRAGSISYNLFQEELGKEKSVDVKLAVDMVTLKDIYDTAILVSGDQDYVPAVQAVKDAGKRVVNVAFRTRDGKMLPGGARRLNQMTDSTIELRYESLKRLLQIQSFPSGEPSTPEPPCPTTKP